MNLLLLASNVYTTRYVGSGQSDTPNAAPAAATTYATVYSTEVPGVYQSSIQAYVGASRSNINSIDKGFINIKYDGDV